MRNLLRALIGVATTMTISGANAAQSLPDQETELQSKAAWDEAIQDGSMKAYTEFSLKYSDDPRAKIARSKLEDGIAIERGASEAGSANSSINDANSANTLIYV